MKHIAHVKFRIGFLMLLLVLCAVMEPVLSTSEASDQISVVDDIPSDDTSNEEPEAEESGEEDQDLPFETIRNFTWNGRKTQGHTICSPGAIQNLRGIESPPELV